jgi:hypothetical protein
VLFDDLFSDMEGIYRVSGVGGFRIDLVLVALACDLIGDGFW